MLCTGVNPLLLNKPTKDEELNELLLEVRNKTKRNFQVIERTYTIKHLCWKNEIGYNYELLVEVGGILPFQVITCARTIREIKAYLFGTLNNFEINEDK